MKFFNIYGEDINKNNSENIAFEKEVKQWLNAK